ncbi:MAG: enoyl-CoA hydratase-related protein [Aestuariivirga sp.]
MTFETILVETNGKTGIITLSRPKALNALNVQLIAEMNQALDHFEADSTIAAIILTGSEKAFAAGADIREMKDKTFAEVKAENFLSDWDHINTITKPIIAAVSGFALGGGCEFALACDTIIASDTAKFGLPETGLGIIPGGGGTQRLVRALGKAKAFDLMITGRMLTAEEALNAGLVARVVPQANLMAEALGLAEKISSLSMPVVKALKQAVKAADELPLSQGLKKERELIHSLFALEDQKEGMAAFLEKRKPEFKNK